MKRGKAPGECIFACGVSPRQVLIVGRGVTLSSNIAGGMYCIHVAHFGLDGKQKQESY